MVECHTRYSEETLAGQVCENLLVNEGLAECCLRPFTRNLIELI